MTELCADYANGRCCAITRKGTRCTGRWKTAMSCIFRADPVTGAATLGPRIVLCHRHAYKSFHPKRFRVVGGWLGAANKYGFGTCVFERATGWEAARMWAKHRRDVKFGEGRDDCL